MATLTAPPTIQPDTRRLTEDDPDYLRLHAATVRRLEASIATFVRELHAARGDTVAEGAAASHFVERHTAELRRAYEAAHNEGVRDYYGAVSASASKRMPYVAPDADRERQLLAFYAPSVARMAAEALRTLHESRREALTEPRDWTRSILLYRVDQLRNKGKFAFEGHMKRIGELKTKIAEHQQAIKGLTGIRSKEATAQRAQARSAIQGHRAEIAQHRAAIKADKTEATRPPTVKELKAAAQVRLTNAKAQVAKAEEAYQSAQKSAAEKLRANKSEIERLNSQRGAADLATYGTHDTAREQIAEQRARAKGEAGKAPKTYQKMLAAEQPMREAQAAHEAAKATAAASLTQRDALIKRYSPNHGPQQYGFSQIHARLMKDHPDYKAAWRQASRDSTTQYKAQYAMWRKEGTYEGARAKLAGKISEADIAAHPLHAAALARLAAVDAKLGDLMGSAALREASDARSAARAELNDAEIVVKFPSWKYTEHSAPLQGALYTSLEHWPPGQLDAARAADNVRGRGNANPHQGDLALRELQRIQGFDAKPDIVSEAQLEQHIKVGEVELWRGESKVGHTDNMMMGEHHAGLGIYGNGTYAQEAAHNGRAVAHSYAFDHTQTGTMMHMSVKDGARVINLDQIRSMAHQAAQAADRAEKNATAKGDTAAVERARTLKWLATSDHSRYAVALGYDAIRYPERGQWIILNRSALRVSSQVYDK